jgi:hypothetical protein
MEWEAHKSSRSGYKTTDYSESYFLVYLSLCFCVLSVFWYKSYILKETADSEFESQLFSFRLWSTLIWFGRSIVANVYNW